MQSPKVDNSNAKPAQGLTIFTASLIVRFLPETCRGIGGEGWWFAGSGEQRVTPRRGQRVGDGESVVTMRDKKPEVDSGLVTTYRSLYWYCLASRVTPRHYPLPLPDPEMMAAGSQGNLGLINALITNKKLDKKNCSSTNLIWVDCWFGSIFIGR